MAHNTLQIGARLHGGPGARAPTFGIKVNVLTPNEAARLGQVISTMRQTASSQEQRFVRVCECVGDAARCRRCVVAVADGRFHIVAETVG